MGGLSRVGAGASRRTATGAEPVTGLSAVAQPAALESVADQVGAADNTNDLAIMHDRDPFDPPCLHQLSDLAEAGQLLDADDLAARDQTVVDQHFDRSDLVQKFVDQLTEIVRSKPDEQRFEVVNVVAGRCLRSLRKLGMRDEIDKLLKREAYPNPQAWIV